jgi:hypothetical protein
MRIIASTAVDRPVFAENDAGELELLMHFGHTAEDIWDAASSLSDSVPVSDFVALWSDPDCPRRFEDIGGSLVISPAEALPMDSADGLQ